MESSPLSVEQKYWLKTYVQYLYVTNPKTYAIKIIADEKKLQ